MTTDQEVRAMNKLPHIPTALLLSTTLTTVMVTIHHVFRLGPEFLAPAAVLIAAPLVTMRWLSTRGSRSALSSLVFVNGFIFVWFGLVDGIFDHVFKAIGLENMTLLPGGEADMVETYYSLGSQGANAAFYEGTGLIQALASLAMLYLTYRFVQQQWRSAHALAL